MLLSTSPSRKKETERDLYPSLNPSLSLSLTLSLSLPFCCYLQILPSPTARPREVRKNSKWFPHSALWPLGGSSTSPLFTKPFNNNGTNVFITERLVHLITLSLEVRSNYFCSPKRFSYWFPHSTLGLSVIPQPPLYTCKENILYVQEVVTHFI